MSDKFRDGLEEDFQETSQGVPTANDLYPNQSLPPARPIGNGLMVKDGGSFAYKRFLIKPTGLEQPPNMQKWEWEEVGKHIKALDTSIAWVIGDWALMANKTWRMTYAKIAEDFGYEASTVETYASVCDAIHGLIRNQTVSFAHHRQLVNLADDMVLGLQRYILTQKLTVDGLKTEMAALRRSREENRYAWIVWALENNAKLSEQPELKPPTYDPPPEVAQAGKYQKQVNKAAPNLSALDSKRRQQVAEKADWLSAYYADIARRARGE